MKIASSLWCIGSLAVALLTAVPAEAADLFPPEAKRRLDVALQDVVKAKNLPSLAVALAVPGRGRYVFIGGIADLATKARRTAGQPFRIASLTKTLTATAVLLLVDDGRLAKGDALAKWFPDFPNAGKITIDDLLRMRSGIAAPSDADVIDAIYDNPTGPAPTLDEEMAAAAAKRDTFKRPGTVGIYSNLDYDILGAVVRKVTGEDVGAVITDRVIKPLGLAGTAYPTTDALPGGLHGYGWNGQMGRFVDKTAFNPAIAGPSGAMISTIDDLERYVRVLCQGGLLKPATQAARMQGQSMAGTTTMYGEGVITGPGACGHSGTIPGFSTDMYYLPAQDATMIISASRLDRDDALQTIAAQVAIAAAMKSLPTR